PAPRRLQVPLEQRGPAAAFNPGAPRRNAAARRSKPGPPLRHNLLPGGRQGVGQRPDVRHGRLPPGGKHLSEGLQPGKIGRLPWRSFWRWSQMIQKISEDLLWSQIVARAWCDDGYMKRLRSDPRNVLTEHGMELPEGMDVKVVDGAEV